jgi:hypothetical protein
MCAGLPACHDCSFSFGAASLFNPSLGFDASFLEEPVMLLAFVLLGRAMEARAKVAEQCLSNASAACALLGIVAGALGCSDFSQTIQPHSFCHDMLPGSAPVTVCASAHCSSHLVQYPRHLLDV